MVKKARLASVEPEIIDVACVIYGQEYPWHYVERLHSMLSRHLTKPFNLHVYTEFHRSVPDSFIKHALIEMSIPPNKRAWWYKMQLFNSDFHRGPLLYLDLDTVIVNNIDWIWQQSTRHFWAIRDFKHLWKPFLNQINSSIMWWDTALYDHVWRQFHASDINEVCRKYHGDQDFIDAHIPSNQRRYFDSDTIRSWRWECLDGGFNFQRRQFYKPGTGTAFGPETSVLVFHGKPKPGDVDDPVIRSHWC